MLNDIHNYALIGLVHSQAFPSSNESSARFVETLKKILRDDYFDAVEISQIPFPELNEEVPSLIHQSHTKLIYCGHSRLFKNKLNINSLNEEERLKAVNELKKGIDEAKSFGSDQFQFLSRNYEDDKVKEALLSLEKSTRELCSYAKKKNMFVTLEIFDYDIDKCSLLGPSSRVLEFSNMVKDVDNFGFMPDSSHIPLIKESIEESINPIAKRIFHAHMGSCYKLDKANPAYGDMHPRFGYPGGENDVNELAAYLQKLYDIGYLKEGGNNVLSFEIKPVKGEDEELVVANAKRSLKQAWRMVH